MAAAAAAAGAMLVATRAQARPVAISVFMFASSRRARKARAQVRDPRHAPQPSYFPAQKSGVQDDRSVTRTQQDPQRGRVGCRGLLSGGLLASLLLRGSPDVNEVVGDHAEPDP